MNAFLYFLASIEDGKRRLRFLQRHLRPSALLHLLSPSALVRLIFRALHCVRSARRGGTQPPESPGATKLNVSMNSNHMQKGLEYWHLSGSPDAAFAVVIVPGNPGIGKMYIPLARALQQKLGKKKMDGVEREEEYPVYAVTYFGSEQPRGRRRRPSSLDVNHEPDRLRAFLDFVYAKEAKPIIVMGHSIGAWIVCKALGSPHEYSNLHTGERYAAAHHVHQIVLMFPFLEVDIESRPTRYKKHLLQYRILRELIALAWQCMTMVPDFILRIVLQILATGRVNYWTNGCGQDIVDALMETFGRSAHYVLGTLSHAHSQMRTLTSDYVRKSGGKTDGSVEEREFLSSLDVSRRPSSSSMTRKIVSAPSFALLSSPTVNYGSALDPLRVNVELHRASASQPRDASQGSHRPRMDSATRSMEAHNSCMEGGSSQSINGGNCNVDATDGTFFHYYAKKILLLYTDGDPWAPLKDAATILKNVNDKGLIFHKFDGTDVHHAFLLNPRETVRVAEVISQHVKKEHPNRRF
eukprot:GEMP01008795.1.p1 GENE.GEMP01008795.1~~GEMP01008795.1.p1  ORF type:complete len:524 (+),score=136.80 GEMP01008795.1:274-1845(+)